LLLSYKFICSLHFYRSTENNKYKKAYFIFRLVHSFQLQKTYLIEKKLWIFSDKNQVLKTIGNWLPSTLRTWGGIFLTNDFKLFLFCQVNPPWSSRGSARCRAGRMRTVAGCRSSRCCETQELPRAWSAGLETNLFQMKTFNQTG